MSNENTYGMNFDRYIELIESEDATLTEDEIEHGWHWCGSWDDMLVGPGMDSALVCSCDVPKIEEWKNSPQAKLIQAIVNITSDNVNDTGENK